MSMEKGDPMLRWSQWLRTYFMVFVLGTTLAPGSVRCQSLWIPRDRDQSVLLEILKPGLEYIDEDTFTAAFFLDGRFALGPNVFLVGEGSARRVKDLLEELSSRGRTILLSTHVMYQAEKICDRLLLIHKGKKQLDATLPEIRARFDPRTIRYEPLEMSAGREATLARMPGVVGARTTQDGAAYELALAENADGQVILRELLALGPARSVALERVSLEEVFVRVVRQAEGEQAAAEAQEDLAHAQGV